jgi:hypothetical protein
LVLLCANTVIVVLQDNLWVLLPQERTGARNRLFTHELWMPPTCMKFKISTIGQW